jgi:hypothetical protein
MGYDHLHHLASRAPPRSPTKPWNSFMLERGPVTAAIQGIPMTARFAWRHGPDIYRAATSKEAQAVYGAIAAGATALRAL